MGERSILEFPKWAKPEASSIGHASRMPFTTDPLAVDLTMPMRPPPCPLKPKLEVAPPAHDKCEHAGIFLDHGCRERRPGSVSWVMGQPG
jgi:hypothetical protein